MLKQELPEVESFVRFRTVRRCLLQHGENTFYESGGLYADPQVFEVFSFKFIEGDPATALAAPNAIVLTKSLAHKFFGENSALGQRVTLNGSTDFVVQGVLADVPSNSHFHFDFARHRACQRIDCRKLSGILSFSIYAGENFERPIECFLARRETAASSRRGAIRRFDYFAGRLDHDLPAAGFYQQ
jgi:hypothetical protein